MLYTNCYDEYGNSIDHYTQYDINQTVRIDIGENELSTAPNVHFSNASSDYAKEVQGTLSDTIVSASIPNELLQEASMLNIHVYVADPENSTSQKTLVTVNMPVRARMMPESYSAESTISCTAVSLNSTSKTLSSGATYQLIATVTPYNTTSTLSWSSSNTSVATVSSAGLVTAVSTGTATITAACGSVSKTCTITVS